jgi:nucleoside-diphosphate-sugar epimerase
MAKVLITGGLGFIGQHCSKAFREKGWTVTILDMHDTQNKSDFHNLVSDGITVTWGDIRNIDDVKKAMKGCDAVVHLAAQISVLNSYNEPQLTMETNVVGTKNVLECALKYSVPKLILASSAAVYGITEKIPVDEEATLNCLSPYALSKLENEKQILSVRRDGMDAIALRFFNVYGAGQNLDMGYAAVIPTFISRMKSHKCPIVHGSGLQSRDFIHVDDVVKAITTLIESPEYFEHPVANVCSNTERSILDIINIINESLIRKGMISTPLLPVFEDSREGEILRSCGDNSRLKQMIDWEIANGFRDSIFNLIDTYELAI